MIELHYKDNESDLCFLGFNGGGCAITSKVPSDWEGHNIYLSPKARKWLAECLAYNYKGK